MEENDREGKEHLTRQWWSKASFTGLSWCWWSMRYILQPNLAVTPQQPTI
jgi:hypothetical protein